MPGTAPVQRRWRPVANPGAYPEQQISTPPGIGKRWHPDRFTTDLDQQRQALERFHAICAYAMLQMRRAAPRFSPARELWRQGIRPVLGCRAPGSGGWAARRRVLPSTAIRHAAPPPPARLLGDQSASPGITVGSTHDAVRAIQGPRPGLLTSVGYEITLYFKAGAAGRDIWLALLKHLLPRPCSSGRPLRSARLRRSWRSGHTDQRLWEYKMRVFFTAITYVTRWKYGLGHPCTLTSCLLNPGRVPLPGE